MQYEYYNWLINWLIPWKGDQKQKTEQVQLAI